MAKTPDEFYKIIHDQNREISRLKEKMIHAQAQCYELLTKDMTEPIKDEELKAQNYYLTAELKRVIEQRDIYKAKVSAAAVAKAYPSLNKSRLV